MGFAMYAVLLEMLGADTTLIKWDRRLGREQNNALQTLIQNKYQLLQVIYR